MDAEPKRRWFQFSLRTLLLFGTLCAVPIILIAAILVAWTGGQPAEDSWYNPLPNGLGPLDGWKDVPAADMLVVDAAKMDKAVALPKELFVTCSTAL
jgi:hypothetical protein